MRRRETSSGNLRGSLLCRVRLPAGGCRKEEAGRGAGRSVPRWGSAPRPLLHLGLPGHSRDGCCSLRLLSGLVQVSAEGLNKPEAGRFAGGLKILGEISSG